MAHHFSLVHPMKLKDTRNNMPKKLSAAAQAIEDMKKTEQAQVKKTEEESEVETQQAVEASEPPEPKKAKASTKSIDEQIQEAVTKAIAALPQQNMAELMKQILPATIMAVEQAKSMSGHEANLKALKLKQALEEKCHICQQVVGDGKARGCGGPWSRLANGDFRLDEKGQRIEDIGQFHVKMVVFPNDPIAERQWDGVKINGAVYCSQGPGHKVWVPAKNDIHSQILKFEEDQRIQQVGRKHMRKSGAISGNGGQQVQSPIFT